MANPVNGATCHPFVQRPRFRNIIGRLVTSLAIPFALAAAEPPEPKSPPKLSNAEASNILFTSLIPRIQLEIAPGAVQSLRDKPREYVPCILRAGGLALTNVAIKLKGARGSFRSVDAKPAFTLNTDKFVDGQEFHGLDKFHLNNSVQDPTCLNEIIASELHRSVGVPTARATHARVILNNRDLGLYVLKEGYDGRFLKANFANPDGNLYDGGFLQDIDEPLERDAGDGPNNWSDLRRLFAAAHQPDLDRRLEFLEATVDLDHFITYAAVQMLTCDWDGYMRNRNNYRLYFEPDTRRFKFIPHGMDQLFQNVNYPIIPVEESAPGRRGPPTRGGLVAVKAFEIPEVQTRYLQRVGQLLKGEFTVASLNRQLDVVEARVRRELITTDPKAGAHLLSQIQQTRRKLADRVRVANGLHSPISRNIQVERQRIRPGRDR